MLFYLLVVNKNYVDLFIISNINTDNALIPCGNNTSKAYYARPCVSTHLKISIMLQSSDIILFLTIIFCKY